MNFFRNRNTLGKIPTLKPSSSGGTSGIVWNQTIQYSTGGPAGNWWYYISNDGKFILPVIAGDSTSISGGNRYNFGCYAGADPNALLGDGKTGTALCAILGKTFVKEYKAAGNANYPMSGTCTYYNGTSWTNQAFGSFNGYYPISYIECA